MSDPNSNAIMKPVREHDVVSTLSSMPSASYNLDINLEKLMYCAITIIHKHEMDNKADFNPKDKVSITAENFYQLLYEDASTKGAPNVLTSEESRNRKTRMQNVHRIMVRAYERFTSSPVMLVKVDGSDIPEKVTMILKLHYEPKTKVFSIQFAEEFFKFFYNLLKFKNNSFNRHELKQIMKMNSYYSLRLYRIFNSEIWRTNRLVFSYDELRRMFMKEHQYKQHIHFKTRIIEPAIQEINSLTNIEVTYKFLKTSGNSIDAVEFSFDYKQNYINNRMVKALEKLKIAYAKKAIPWKDDLSHFQDPDRINHFTPPTVLKPKQIKFLISSPVFMNDYAQYFFPNFDDSTSKTIMKALLTDKLAVVNSKKPIDLDYYFAINYQEKAANNEEGGEDDENEDNDE
ncbi:replication initiation protein [Acinetobacter baumannii]